MQISPNPMAWVTFQRRCYLEKLFCYVLAFNISLWGFIFLNPQNIQGVTLLFEWVSCREESLAAELLKEHKAIRASDRKCQWTQWPTFLCIAFYGFWSVVQYSKKKKKGILPTLRLFLSTFCCWSKLLDCYTCLDFQRWLIKRTGRKLDKGFTYVSSF